MTNIIIADKKSGFNLINQADSLAWSNQFTTIDASNFIIHMNLLKFELSLKSLFAFYLGEYEKTHFFKDGTLLVKLYKKIQVPDDIKEVITKYREISKELYSPSRYNELKLEFWDKQVTIISEMADKMFSFVYALLYTKKAQNTK